MQANSKKNEILSSQGSFKTYRPVLIGSCYENKFYQQNKRPDFDKNTDFTKLFSRHQIFYINLCISCCSWFTGFWKKRKKHKKTKKSSKTSPKRSLPSFHSVRNFHIFTKIDEKLNLKTANATNESSLLHMEIYLFKRFYDMLLVVLQKEVFSIAAWETAKFWKIVKFKKEINTKLRKTPR